MVVTIEPGIYVPPLAPFPKHYHNMGVRIEACHDLLNFFLCLSCASQDEVLVGKNHPVVLSVSAPKEVCSYNLLSALATDDRYVNLDRRRRRSMSRKSRFGTNLKEDNLSKDGAYNIFLSILKGGDVKLSRPQWQGFLRQRLSLPGLRGRCATTFLQV
jgi:hypothetical protein